MPSAFLTGIRNLRSSFLTGTLIIASIYIIMVNDGSPTLNLRPSAQHLLDLHSSVPVMFLVVSAYIVGSLYVTALEGIVDWIHRKLLFTQVTDGDSFSRRIFLSTFTPLSDVSRRRLSMEAERYFKENSVSIEEDKVRETCERFVHKVFADVLWMDGKLTGTSLREIYAEYRTEGEFRLGIGLVLPLGAVAVVYATQLSLMWSTMIVVLVVFIAVQTCNYGLYYFRRAHSFLAHHISDGTLLTPSMVTLKRVSNLDKITQS